MKEAIEQEQEVFYEEPDFEDNQDPEDIDNVEDLLIDEMGFDEDEVNEMLYDPAPRRSRRRRRRARRYDPAPKRSRRRRRRARRYDPAPRASTAYPKKRRFKRRAKGALAKLKKYVMPGTAGLTFYTAYTQRAKDLFAAGKITKDSVLDAVMFDVKNFDGSAAMQRVQDSAADIAAPAIGGMIIKAVKPGGQIGKVGGIFADALMGYATGKLAKVVLDPPIHAPTAKPNSIKAPSAEVTPAVITTTTTRNPYEV